MDKNRFYHCALLSLILAVFYIGLPKVNNDFRSIPNVSSLIIKHIFHVGHDINILFLWTLPCIVKNVNFSLPWKYSQPIRELRTKARDNQPGCQGRKMAYKEYPKNFKKDHKSSSFKERKYNRHVLELNYSSKYIVNELFRKVIPNKIMTNRCQNAKYHYYNTNVAGKVSFGNASFKYFAFATIIMKEIIWDCLSGLFVLLMLIFWNTNVRLTITTAMATESVGLKTSQRSITFNVVHRRSNNYHHIIIAIDLTIFWIFNYQGSEKLRVDLENFKTESYEKLNKLSINADYTWLRSPRGQISGHLKNILAYPVTQFYRLATFRPLAYTEMPDSMFFINLSSAGFFYPGTGTSVTCYGCRNTVELASFRSEPTEIKYHMEGCQFVASAGELGMYVDRNDATEWSTERSTLGEVRNEALKSPSKNVRLGDGSPGGNVIGDADDGINMTPPDMSTPPLLIVAQHENEQQHERERGAAHGVTGRINQPNTGQWMPSGDIGDESIHSSSSSASSADSAYKSSSSLTLFDQRYASELELYGSEFEIERPFCDIKSFKPENPAFFDKRFQMNKITARCDKNPGHLSSFPLSYLNVDHLPSNLKHKLVMEFLRECAQLTLKIAVTKLSSKRPFGDKSNLTDVNSIRIGTGSVLNHPYHIGTSGSSPEYADQSEVITRLRQAGSVPTNLKRIFIETSRNLIFNNEEAQHSTVQLMFDTSGSLHGADIRGKSVIHSTLLGDFKSVLVCEVPEEIVAMLNKKREAAFKLAERLPECVKEAMTRHVFIVSYPHGDEARVSHGESTSIKYVINIVDREGRLVGELEKIHNQQPELADLEKTRRTLLYTAATCDGSVGAPVITFKRRTSSDQSSGQSEYQLDIWVHYGFDTVHELNVSMMKTCTATDFSSHEMLQTSITNVSRPSGPPSATEANRSTDQLTNLSPEVSPYLITVLTTPSYPVYSNTQKRLESFTHWPSSHIHTPAHLASSGFFYAGYSDCVRCFQCGLGLKSWKPGDDVIEEHERHRPSCPFLQAQISSGLTNRYPAGQINSNLINRQTVSNIANPDVANADVARASRNSSSEASALLRPDANENLQQQQQKSNEPKVTDLQHQQTTDFVENGLSEASEERIKPKCLPVSLLERENKTLKLQMTCKLCRKAPIKDLFLPCGDLCACSDCSQKLTHCPLCKKLILATVTTYFS